GTRAGAAHSPSGRACTGRQRCRASVHSQPPVRGGGDAAPSARPTPAGPPVTASFRQSSGNLQAIFSLSSCRSAARTVPLWLSSPHSPTGRQRPADGGSVPLPPVLGGGAVRGLGTGVVPAGSSQSTSDRKGAYAYDDPLAMAHRAVAGASLASTSRTPRSRAVARAVGG